MSIASQARPGGNNPDLSQIYVAAISSGMATGGSSFVPMYFVGTKRYDVRTSAGHLARIPISSLYVGTNWSYYMFRRASHGGYEPYCLQGRSGASIDIERDPCCLVNSKPFLCRKPFPSTLVPHHDSRPSVRGYF